jgi:fructose-bisphosphate aldolase class 1
MICILSTCILDFDYVETQNQPIYKLALINDGVQTDSYYIWKNNNFRFFIETDKGITEIGVKQEQIKYTPNELPRYIHYKPKFKNEFFKRNFINIKDEFSEVHIPDKYIKLDIHMKQ